MERSDWLTLGLRHIRIDRLLSFVAVIDSQGFTPAADALHLSQPQVSRHIAELEEALGYRIIDRLAKPPAPTHDGLHFAGHARDILEILRQAGEKSFEYLEGPSGSVLIGMYPSVAFHTYPGLKRSAAASIHNMTLGLWEGMPHELLPALTESAVDLVIRPGHEKDVRSHGQIASRRLWTEPLVAVMQPIDTLRSRSYVSIDDLLSHQLIVIGNPRVPDPPENEVGEALKSADLLTHISMRTDLPATLVAMVRGGLGTGIINALALDTVDTHGLQVRPIEDAGFERTVYLSWRRQDTKRQNIQHLIRLVSTLPHPTRTTP